MSTLCESEFSQVHCAVGNALKRIFNAVVDRNMFNTQQDYLLVKKMVQELNNLLQLKYQLSWIYILDVIRNLFDLFRNIRVDQSHEIVIPLISRLADVYQSIEMNVIEVSPEIHISFGDAIGSAIKFSGLSRFLKTVPIHSTNGVIDDREWIFNLLHKHLKLIPCHLVEFGNTILPLIGKCNLAIKATSPSFSPSQVKLVHTRMMQLWSLLPDFFQHSIPADIGPCFPKLAIIMEEIFNEEVYCDIVPHVVVTLHLLAKEVVGQPQQLAAVSPYCGTFLPLLLKTVETMDIGDPRFPSAVECIGSWAKISTPTLVTAISKKLLQLLLTAGDGNAVWMSVMLVVIPYLSDSLIVLLFKTVRPLLSLSEREEALSLQKRAYQVLDSLLTTHPEVLHRFESRFDILQLVSESLLTCHVSSRNMRFRCIETLMAGMSDEEVNLTAELILGEVLICQKDSNKKSRDGAINIMRIIVNRIDPNELVMKLCSALVAETSLMRSAAVTGFCLLLLEKRDNEEVVDQCRQLIPSVCLLLQEETADQSKAVKFTFHMINKYIHKYIHAYIQ